MTVDNLIPHNSVLLVKCPDYSERNVHRAIRSVFDTFQPVLAHYSAGSRVLLKPNLLLGRPAETCVTTHPLVVKAIVHYLLDYNVRVLIGDSPAVGSARKATRKSGILEALSGYPVEYVEFDKSVRLDNTRGKTFRHIDVARIVTEVDHIINLPKIKSHGQMAMTLAVKNLFGCVVGMRKQEWHLKAGSSHEFFADMLVELAALIKPGLTIVDGIHGMEGNGPQNGTPIPIGLVVAGQDTSAIDRVILECLQIDPCLVKTISAARKQSLGLTDLEKISIIGEKLADCQIERFLLPGIQSLSGNRIPAFLIQQIKKFFTEKPVISPQKCTLCETCIKVCPPQVMSLSERNGQKFIAIDRENCIHCFCCQETCPDNAIQIKAGLGNRFILQRL